MSTSPSPALMDYRRLYRRSARAVGLTGLAIALGGLLIAWALGGGPGLAGGLIGGGTVLLLTLVSVVVLLVPWDERPLLAGLAPMVSFVLKLVVVAVVVLVFAHRDGYSHGAAFAIIVLGVLVTMVVEAVTLASRRAPVVEPAGADGEHS